MKIYSDLTDRLQSNPCLLEFEQNGFRIFLQRGYLDLNTCNSLSEQIRLSSARSTINAGEGHAISEFRTSTTCYFGKGDIDIGSIECNLADLTGISIEHGEPLQGQHYAEGQYFRPHYDFIPEGGGNWEEEVSHGGQRLVTAMVYLNEDFEGGATTFPELGIRIVPERGTLILWSNIRADGEPQQLSRHSGEPVVRGRKTVLTKWIRENHWRP